MLVEFLWSFLPSLSVVTSDKFTKQRMVGPSLIMTATHPVAVSICVGVGWNAYFVYSYVYAGVILKDKLTKLARPPDQQTLTTHLSLSLQCWDYIILHLNFFKSVYAGD